MAANSSTLFLIAAARAASWPSGFFQATPWSCFDRLFLLSWRHQRHQWTAWLAQQRREGLLNFLKNWNYLRWWNSNYWNNLNLLGRGCGAVDRPVASNTRGARFESQLRQFVKSHLSIVLNGKYTNEEKGLDWPFLHNCDRWIKNCKTIIQLW